MNSLRSQSSLPNRSAYSVVAILCVALVASTSRETLAQTPPAPQPDAAAPAEEAAPKIPDAELDSLVAPIALYPDPLLSQALVASTYPVELIQLQQWTKKNTGLKDQALADAVAKQPWDPSIQGLAPFPDVVETLAENIQWTSDLGNAFLAQQADVMAAIQRMRAKAQGTGALKTSAQQKVETQSIDGGQQAIVIQPADPNTVYVPSYDPATVYGAPAVPYPPVTYPGYVAGAALTFGTGLALGAAWGGGWGYNCGWNNGDVDVNVNNKYVNNYNKKNNINSANKNWQHNPQHRGNAPYGSKATANKYGGTARGPGGAGGAGGAGGVGKPGGPGGAGGVGGVGKAGGAGGPGGAGGVGKPGGPGGAGGAGKPGAGGVGKPGGAGSAGGAGKPGGAGGAGKPGGAGGAAAGAKAGGGGAASRPRSPAEAVALTVLAVINPQRAAAAAVALSPEEAGHLPKRPAIVVAAAWEVGEVVEVAAAAAAKKEAEEDAAAKRDERTKNIQTKNYELIKTSVPCVSADGFQFCLCRFNSGAAAEIGYRGWSAAYPKTIQHTKRSG